jgi:signal transduction histidine kinase
VRGRVAGLIAGEGLLVLAGLWVIDRTPVAITSPGLLGSAAFVVVLVGLTLLPRIYLEHARHSCWITPADGAILVGLFTLGPFGFVVAALSAEVLIALRYHQPPLKLTFNLVSMVGGYTAAAATFAAIGRVDPLDPLAWAAGLAAMAACAVWDVVSTAALFAIAERRPFREMLNGLGGALLLSLVLSAALGLVALVLLHETPFGAFLVVPVLGILVVSTRSVSRAEGERHRLERLYAASANLARLVGRTEALSRVAAEARTLVTGAAAISVAAGPDGSWQAVLVDDDGPRELTDEVVGRLRDLTASADHGAAEPGHTDLPGHLAGHRSLVWATGTADPDVNLLVVVLHEHEPDERVDHRVDVLHTFVAQAATVLANVELHDDVREALAHQVELNRQKGEFVAAVSHELRTPLAGVLGAVQTIQRARDRMTPEQLEDVLELGSSQGARLRSLIEDLLLVAAAEHEGVRAAQVPLEVTEVLSTVAGELHGVVGDRLVIHPPAAGAVFSDPDKLHRILVNLVDNARKYAPSGPIDIRAVPLGDRVRFTVDDHGPGVAPEDRDRIFDRFVQLDQSSTRRQGGTGLGLHLSRQLAELLGGELTVAAAPAGGARFVLTLPRGRRADVAAPNVTAARVSKGIAGSPLRPRPAAPRPVAPRPTPPVPSTGHRPAVDAVPTLAGGST